VYAQIFEDEAALIRPGQRAELTSPAFPGRVLNGRVEAVDRVVDPATRTLRARVLVSDGESLLRPEMFLEAVVHVGLGRRLVAPKEALIDTGIRRLVYVKTAPGHYAPREITTGREGENDVEVLTGLEAGETVAASGNFLLDSESRLKSVVSDGKAR
jgi:Cu(I)/Ag(I) efflux system membrane fusion protein